jgi:hypothetical protein
MVDVFVEEVRPLAGDVVLGEGASARERDEEKRGRTDQTTHARLHKLHWVISRSSDLVIDHIAKSPNRRITRFTV